MTAHVFIAELSLHIVEKELIKADKFFRGNDGKTKALGVRFGTVFKIAKDFIAMSLKEIENLLESDYNEVRMGAVSIMDFQAKSKKISPENKKALFDLYLGRHERLNNWDFVDRGAYNIIGEYLADKPRDVLYELAKSENPWERRTAIVSTYAFIKKGELNDTFKIAEMLINDKHELINKAVGSWVREAGKKDKKALIAFLNTHAATMPRVTLRYALEKLEEDKRKYYLSLKP